MTLLNRTMYSYIRGRKKMGNSMFVAYVERLQSGLTDLNIFDDERQHFFVNHFIEFVEDFS